MKQVSATQARREWFRLLDEVAAGEVVVLLRHGRRIVLRREDADDEGPGGSPPDYALLIDAPDLDRADSWRWTWSPEEGLRPAGPEE